MKTNKELKKMDSQALVDELKVMRKELFNLKLNATSTQAKDSSQFHKLRVCIARILTYLKEKEGSK